MIIQYYARLIHVKILICACDRLLGNCFQIVLFKDLLTLAAV